MTKLTKTANSVSQTGGLMQVAFLQLNNLKNTNHKSYAYSKSPIRGKMASKERGPYIVRCKDFKFNIPVNSVVKKITVHYRHVKRATCGDRPEEFTPCGSSSTKKRCNIPAPTFTLLNLGATGKGQAPANTGSNLSKSFTGLWSASSVNSSNFGVEINYPLNTNYHSGFVLLSNLYLSIEYFTPRFACHAMGAHEVYNHQDYSLGVSLSDANLTGKTTSVTISVPVGFTYTGVVSTANGTVEQVSARTLRWTPVMRGQAVVAVGQSASASRVVLGFSVDVSFSGDSASLPCNFEVGLPDTSEVVSYTVNVMKELPVQEEEATGEKSFDSDTSDESFPEIKHIILNEEFEYSLKVDDGTLDSLAHAMYNRSSTSLTYEEFYATYFLRSEILFTRENFQAPHSLSKNGYIYHRWKSDSSRWDDYMDSTGYIGDFINNGQEHSITMKGVHLGMDEIWAIHRDNVNNVYTSICKWSFFIKPVESTLTIPDMSLLSLTEEELNRLGDGYNYILQSNLKLDTDEEYVRDWYRNFRVGVFNNPIEANCNTYYLQASTGTEFQGEIRLRKVFPNGSGRVRIIGYLQYNTWFLIKQPDDTEYQVIGFDQDYQFNTSEYSLPFCFKMEDTYSWEDNNGIFKVTQYDDENNIVDVMEYHITFNKDENIALTEINTDSTDYDNLSKEEIFSNAKYWADNTAGLNTYNNVECEFTYDKNYPLYLIVTGDYPEGAPSDNPVTYNEPCIIEETDYTERKPNGNYPAPIDDLVSSDNVSSETQIPSFTQTETIVFYNLPLDDNYGTNTEMAIRGIELTGNIEQSDRLVLYANLKSQTGESRQRSLVINDYETHPDSVNEFHIGGMGDLWGFSTLDMINMEDWEAELTISNTIENTDASINFGSMQLILYVEPVIEQTSKVYVEGEDLAYYNAFIRNITVPEGLETETDYLKIDGTDTNDPYRQNVKEKTIIIEFDIGESCNLEDNTLSLRDLTRLLVNDRDEYNRPIPKRLELSHYPDVYWEYIMEKALDTEIDISNYHCKAELTIPAGTAYDKVNTTTAATGYVKGIATINPVILVKPTGENISITEEITGQQFHIGYSGDWIDKILEIDCENQIAWLKQNEDDDDPINLNGYVDYNADWFRLKGEYHFTSTNGVVMTVDYAERW